MMDGAPRLPAGVTPGKGAHTILTLLHDYFIFIQEPSYLWDKDTYITEASSAQ